MSAALNSTDSLILTPELDLGVEAFRERLARHVAGYSPESNYEAMVAAWARRNGPEPCAVCDGLGFRPLADHVVAEYAQKIATRRAEAERLVEHIRAAERVDDNPNASELEKKTARQDFRALSEKLERTRENLRRIRREQNRRGVCRPCKGSGVAPRRRRADGEHTERPDSMFTTVTCEKCRGEDRRAHGLLPHHHRGSSSGGVRLRGTRPLPDPDVDGLTRSDPRDDAAAERGDTCVRCHGDAYVQPITVRPTLRTTEVHERPGGVAELPDEAPPESDYTDAIGASGDDARDLVESTRRADPILAAAITLYVGPHGDRWSKHPYGRGFVLWLVADAGRSLAQESRLEPPEPPPEEKPDAVGRLLAVLALERVAEVQQLGGADDRRGALLALADDQARRLEYRVERALHDAEKAA